MADFFVHKDFMDEEIGPILKDICEESTVKETVKTSDKKLELPPAVTKSVSP